MIWMIPSQYAAIDEEGVQLCRTWFLVFGSGRSCSNKGRGYGSVFTHWLHHGTYLGIQTRCADFHLPRGPQLTRTCLESET